MVVSYLFRIIPSTQKSFWFQPKNLSVSLREASRDDALGISTTLIYSCFVIGLKGIRFASFNNLRMNLGGKDVT